MLRSTSKKISDRQTCILHVKFIKSIVFRVLFYKKGTKTFGHHRSRLKLYGTDTSRACLQLSFIRLWCRVVEGGLRGSRRQSSQELRDFRYSQNFKVILRLYYYVMSHFANKYRKDIFEKKILVKIFCKLNLLFQSYTGCSIFRTFAINQILEFQYS